MYSAPWAVDDVSRVGRAVLVKKLEERESRLGEVSHLVVRLIVRHTPRLRPLRLQSQLEAPPDEANKQR